MKAFAPSPASRWPRPFQRAALFAASLLLPACAVTEGHVNIAYTSASPGVTKIAGAETTAVQVTINDQRPSKDTVGHKSNGYGMEMARITSDNDITQTLESAIESELTARGFTVANGGGVSLVITLSKFENRFITGFWSGTSEAEIVMNAMVKTASGNMIYTKLIDADGIEKGIEMASPENAQISLDLALRNGIAELFGDNAFIAALQAAGKASAQVRAAPALNSDPLHAMSQPAAAPSATKPE